jgi:hypothetical protein
LKSCSLNFQPQFQLKIEFPFFQIICRKEAHNYPAQLYIIGYIQS